MLPDHHQRICLFCQRAAKVFDGAVSGGAELQVALLARALAGAGYTVALVDPLFAGPPSTVDGVALVGVPGWQLGVRGLRFFTHRLPGLWKVLRSLRPVLFYVRGFSFLYLIPLAAARIGKAKFVLGTASDADLDSFSARFAALYRGKKSLWDWISTVIPNEVGHWLLVDYADVVLVQHEGQEALARQKRITARICRNIADDRLCVEEGPVGPRNSVILIGTLSVYKGLDVLPAIVERLPECLFELVGKVTDSDGARIQKVLRNFPNVVLHGSMSRNETMKRLAAARILLNTSPCEGFPNTFLEAWTVGTPVVSLHVDPGGVLSREGLGVYCGSDIDRLVTAIRTLSPVTDRQKIREYIRTRHGAHMAAAVFCNILKECR